MSVFRGVLCSQVCFKNLYLGSILVGYNSISYTFCGFKKFPSHLLLFTFKNSMYAEALSPLTPSVGPHIFKEI